MFCEPYLYVTAIVNLLYIYMYGTPCIFICMVRQLCNKRQLSGNNDPRAWGVGRPGGIGSMSLTSISVHAPMLDQIIDERTQKQCVMNVYVKTISMFSETHGV